MTARFPLGLAALAFAGLACEKKPGDGVLRVKVSARSRIADLTGFHVKLDDAGKIAETDVYPDKDPRRFDLGPGQFKTFGIEVGPDTGTLTVVVEAWRDTLKVASGSVSGVKPLHGEIVEVDVTLGDERDGGLPDGTDGPPPDVTDGPPGERPTTDADAPPGKPPESTATPGSGRHPVGVMVEITTDRPADVFCTLDPALPKAAIPPCPPTIPFDTAGLFTLHFFARDSDGLEEDLRVENYDIGFLPQVDRVEPMTATAGATVFLTGQHFKGASVVLIGGHNGVAGRSLAVAADDRLTFVVPPDAPSGDIVVRNAYGETPYPGFLKGNCLEGGWDTDLLPDPGDGTYVFDGNSPWFDAFVVPSRTGRELRVFGGLWDPAGRIDLSDLPEAVPIEAVEWIYEGPLAGHFAVLRAPSDGPTISIVDAFGTHVSDIPFTMFGAGSEAPRGIVALPMTGGQLVVATNRKVHILRPDGSPMGSWDHSCGTAGGVALVYDAPKAGYLLLACDGRVRISTLANTDPGFIGGDHTGLVGLASVPSDPPFFFWIRDDRTAHERKLQFEDLAGAVSIDTIDLGGEMVSDPETMGLATLFDERYVSNEVVLVQRDRLVTYDLGGFTSSKVALKTIEPVGAAIVTKGPSLGSLGIADAMGGITRVDIGSGATEEFFMLDPGSRPFDGLFFQPQGLVAGAFGTVSNRSDPPRVFQVTLGGEPMPVPTPLSPRAKQSMTWVPLAPGSASGYYAALSGTEIEFFGDTFKTIHGPLTFDCQIDERAEVAGTSDKRLLVFDYQDGRIDFLSLVANGPP